MKKYILLFLLFAISAKAQQHVPVNAIRQSEITSDTTNSTTGLKGTPLRVSLDSNSTWEIDAYLLVASSDQNGVEVALDIPSGATVRASALGGADSTVLLIKTDKITADATAGVAWLPYDSGGSTGWVWIHGIVTMGSTTGAVIVEHKKPTAGVGTLKAKSYIKATKIR